jgi:hypothetical protein
MFTLFDIILLKLNQIKLNNLLVMIYKLYKNINYKNFNG